MIQRTKQRMAFLVNNLLLLSGIAMVISGLVLQAGFHIGSARGNHDTRTQLKTANTEQVREINPSGTIWGVDYNQWSLTHKSTIVVFSFFMLYHIAIHWKWYKVVITKHLLRKNRPVIILSVFFILAAATGIISWLLDLSGSNSVIRKEVIEIHDKLALVLIIYLVSHVLKRVRWFSQTFRA